MMMYGYGTRFLRVKDDQETRTRWTTMYDGEAQPKEKCILTVLILAVANFRNSRVDVLGRVVAIGAAAGDGAEKIAV